jgi:hypothetical protein
MIPFDFFYGVYDNHFFNKLGISILNPVFNNDRLDFEHQIIAPDPTKKVIVFYDQEPIDIDKFYGTVYRNHKLTKEQCKIVVSSEYSTESTIICKDYELTNVQYFYHALLCHEWYRNYWYSGITVNTNFDRTYITYNNQILSKRLYRANLIIELHKRDMIEDGYVSYNNNKFTSIVNSLKFYTMIPGPHKANIVAHLDLLKDQLVIDTATPHGELSAAIDVDGMQKAFVNLVTETIFYENKQHLTEKIFKPIVAKMPFLLLAGAGNLAYLRSYGFKTFGEFWDESYDEIDNSTDRFNAVLSILEDLCTKSHAELVEVKMAMADILEYNFNHFYKTMRPIVVDEFTDGLGAALTAAQIDYDPVDLQNLNRILTY